MGGAFGQRRRRILVLVWLPPDTEVHFILLFFFLFPCLLKKNKNRLIAISWCPHELFHFRSVFLQIIFLELRRAVAALNLSNPTPTLCTWCFMVLIADLEHVSSIFPSQSLMKQRAGSRTKASLKLICSVFSFPKSSFPVSVFCPCQELPWLCSGVLQSITYVLSLFLLLVYYAWSSSWQIQWQVFLFSMLYLLLNIFMFNMS